LIHHFPNFVCWKEIFSLYNSDRDIVYLDSILCFLLGLMLGQWGNYFSGPQMAHRLVTKSPSKFYFLLAEDIDLIDEDKKLILPFKSSFEGDVDLLDFLETLPIGVALIIGVSSPKQNVLAHYLHSLRPDVEYFCLGAAVKITWGMKHANTRLRGTGLQWLEFLALHPQRTVMKISSSAHESLRILSSFKSLKLFRNFVIVSKESTKFVKNNHELSG
jgi:hypothetical protein